MNISNLCYSYFISAKIIAIIIKIITVTLTIIIITSTTSTIFINNLISDTLW